MGYIGQVCIIFLQIRIGNSTIKSDLEAYKYQFEANAMDNGFVDERNKCFCREGMLYIYEHWLSIFVHFELAG